MSGEVVISLLFFTASLQPVAADGWRSPRGSHSPFAGLRVGFLPRWCLAGLSPGLRARLGWAPGRSGHRGPEGGVGKGAAGGVR